jgi:hypothetical protein
MRRTVRTGGRARSATAAGGAPETPAPGASAPGIANADSVPVTLDWQLAASVLALIATTPRRGASCHDRWSMSPSVPLTSTTILDACAGRTCYVSRASAPASGLARDTTYTFSYAIVMTGERTWVGSSSVTVTLGPEGAEPAPETANARA